MYREGKCIKLSEAYLCDKRLQNFYSCYYYLAYFSPERTVLTLTNAGVYFISITSGKETSIKKVIVDK